MDNPTTLREMVECSIIDYVNNRGYLRNCSWNDIKLKDLIPVLSDYDDEQLLSILELATIYFYRQR